MDFAFSSRSFMQLRFEALAHYLGPSARMLAVMCELAAMIISISFVFGAWWTTGSRKLPPSPRAWPIIGHLHLLGSAPYKSMAQLSQKYGPLMFLRLGSKPHIVVASSEMAKEIYKRHDLNFSHRPDMSVMGSMANMKDGFAFASDSQWRTLRKIFVTELTSSKRKQQSQKIRAEETSLMLKSIFDDISANPEAPIELFSKVQTMVVNLISRNVLSRRLSSVEKVAFDRRVEVEEFTHISNEVALLLEVFFIGDYIPWLSWLDTGRRKHAAAVHVQLQDVLTRLLNEHRAKRKQDGDSHVDHDMVDVLLSHQEQEGEQSITDENVRAVTWDTFMAATETVVSVTEWTIAHLLRYPQTLAKLKTEIDNVVGTQRKVTEGDIPELKYLQAVIKEVFRLRPPAPLLLTHESHQPCTVAGYYIPPHTQLHVNVYSIGRDPGVWERPLEFSPERFLEESKAGMDPTTGQFFDLIPFGSGRRICPAASYGLVTPQLLVASLVQAFQLSLPDAIGANGVDMEEDGARIVVRMASPLQLHVQPRFPQEFC